MTKERLWQIIVDRNPGIDGRVTLGAGQARKLFDLVWEKATEESINRVDRGADLFQSLFGGK